MSDNNFDFGSTVSDEDKKFHGKSLLEFGLNELRWLKVSPNKMAGKKVGGNPTEGNALDFTFEISGVERNERLYEPVYGNKVYKGETQIGSDHEDYNDCFKMQMDERRVWLVHLIKAFGATDAGINASVQSGKPTSFLAWCKCAIKALPADYKTKTIHCFIEWQSKVGKGKTKTFTQLPKNMKGGKFFTPFVAPDGNGGWEPQTVLEGTKKGQLIYVDGAGNEHPVITRSKSFMESTKGRQTDKTQSTGTRRRGGGGITVNDGGTAHPVVNAEGLSIESSTGAEESTDW